jgi:hypothetical protein
MPLECPAGAKLLFTESDWHHLYNADLISMRDKWEYP